MINWILFVIFKIRIQYIYKHTINNTQYKQTQINNIVKDGVEHKKIEQECWWKLVQKH